MDQQVTQREARTEPDAVGPPARRSWVGRAVVEGVVFALVVALLSAAGGPILASRLAEATREPTCSDPRDLVRVAPVGSAASSYLPPETTRAGRSLRYDHPMAIDGDTGTAWVEGKPGLGQEEWIELAFPKRIKIELICVVNGYALTWDLYQTNPRVRGLRVTGRNAVAVVLTDAGTPDRPAVFQDVRIRDLRPTDRVRLTITSVYAAAGRQRYEDTSLGELEFWAAS